MFLVLKSKPKKVNFANLPGFLLFASISGFQLLDLTSTLQLEQSGKRICHDLYFLSFVGGSNGVIFLK